MYVVTKVDYHRYTRYATILYVVSFILMALVQTPLGVEVNGARRWLRFPVIQRFQPSEITKIAMILFIPYLICKFGKKAYTKKGGASDSPVWNTCGGRCIRADGKLKYSDHCIWNFGCYFFCGLPTDKKDRNCFCLPCGWRTDCGTDSGKAFGVQRELPFTENPLLGGPGKIRQKRSFQTMQGLLAIGSGGFFGKGLGGSAQKMVIPEPQNDMILSIICEELGGLRTDRCPGTVWNVALPSDVYRTECAGSLWIADRDRSLRPHRHPGSFERSGCAECDSDDRNYTAVYQLRRYFSGLSDD